jgi:hypothetical protein
MDRPEMINAMEDPVTIRTATTDNPGMIRIIEDPEIMKTASMVNPEVAVAGPIRTMTADSGTAVMTMVMGMTTRKTGFGRVAWVTIGTGPRVTVPEIPVRTIAVRAMMMLA